MVSLVFLAASLCSGSCVQNKWKHCTHEEWVAGGQDILRRMAEVQNKLIKLQLCVLFRFCFHS